jgi:hypothetical protein
MIQISCIKFKRLHWAGHVQRLPLYRIPKKAMKAQFTGTRAVGKPRFKWEEGVKKMLPDFSDVAAGS